MWQMARQRPQIAVGIDDQPRHLRPEAFGHPASTQGDESEAVRAAGTDAQLRAAVQHLRSHTYLQSRTTPRSPRRG